MIYRTDRYRDLSIAVLLWYISMTVMETSIKIILSLRLCDLEFFSLFINLISRY